MQSRFITFFMIRRGYLEVYYKYIMITIEMMLILSNWILVGGAIYNRVLPNLED